MDPKIGRYADIFDAPIFGTDAYFYTCENKTLLPVFHCLQRPPKQILVIRGEDKQLRFLLLSQFETNDVQQHLTKLYQENPKAVSGAWLIQPDGTLLAKGEGMQDSPKMMRDSPKGCSKLMYSGAVSILSMMKSIAIWLRSGSPVTANLKSVFLNLNAAAT